MHRYSSTRSLPGDGVRDCEELGHLSAGVEGHRRVETGDLARPQARFDGEQDHGAIAGGIGGLRGFAQRALQHERGDDFGLLAGRGECFLSLEGRRRPTNPLAA